MGEAGASGADAGAGPPEPWDVIVVGAGPTGLLLAGELARREARVLVLERAAAPDVRRKGNGVVGRAGVELARRGILAGTGLRPRRTPAFLFGPLPLRLGLGPGSPLHILPVPQRRLEATLDRHARTHGAVIRRGCAVTAVNGSTAAVDAEVPAGPRGRETARYLVGCDGSHSIVRQAVGIGFPGFSNDALTRIATVTIPAGGVTRTRDGIRIPGVATVAAMRPNRLPGGGFSLAPLRVLDRTEPADRYLISTREHHAAGSPRVTPTAEDLRASVRRVLGGDLPFTDARDLRVTIGGSRLAEAYRRGRVFLAGDAAHIFNAGGSGLNAGLLDALDLAERLAAACHGNADADLLDGYPRARRAAGLRMLALTRAQAMLGRDDELSRAVHAMAGGLLASRAAARRVARLLEDP